MGPQSHLNMRLSAQIGGSLTAGTPRFLPDTDEDPYYGINFDSIDGFPSFLQPEDQSHEDVQAPAGSPIPAASSTHVVEMPVEAPVPPPVVKGLAEVMVSPDPLPASPIKTQSRIPLRVRNTTPNGPSRKRKAATITDSEWEPWKEEIKRLHIAENKTLKEVMRIMERDHGFIATERQFTTIKAKWGLNKNILSSEKNFIACKQAERRRRDPCKREFRFKVRGQLVEWKKIERWLKDEPIYIQDFEEGPKTPEDIEYRTITDTLSRGNYRARIQEQSPVLTIELEDVPTSRNGIDAHDVFDTHQRPAELLVYFLQQSLMQEIPRKFTQLQHYLDEGQPEALDVLDQMRELAHFAARFPLAEKFARRFLKICRKHFGDGDTRTITGFLQLGTILFEMGKFSKAEEMHRTATTQARLVARGTATRLEFTCQTNLASTLNNMGRGLEAGQLLDESVENHEKILGHDHLDTAESICQLAAVEYRRGNHAQAKPLFKDYLAIDQRLRAKGQKGVPIRRRLQTLTALTRIHACAGELKDAAETKREALELARELTKELTRQKVKPTDYGVLFMKKELGMIEMEAGNLVQALKMYEEVSAESRQTMGEHHPFYHGNRRGVAKILFLMRRYGEAEAVAREILDTTLKDFEPEYKWTVELKAVLAEIYMGTGREEEGLALMDDCYRLEEEYRPDSESGREFRDKLKLWGCERLG